MRKNPPRRLSKNIWWGTMSIGPWRSSQLGCNACKTIEDFNSSYREFLDRRRAFSDKHDKCEAKS